MAGSAHIHPRAQDLIAHTVHARVMSDVERYLGDDATNERAAEVLADALGYALAMCALDGIDQHSLDQISARTPDYYTKTLAPFLERMGG